MKRPQPWACPNCGARCNEQDPAWTYGFDGWEHACGGSTHLAAPWNVVEELRRLRLVRDRTRDAFGEGYSAGISAGHSLSPPPDEEAAWRDSWIADEVETKTPPAAEGQRRGARDKDSTQSQEPG